MRTFISVLTLGLLCTAAPSKPTTTLHHTTLVLEHASEGGLRATQQRARELDGVVTIQLPSSTIHLAEPLRLTHRDSHTRWQGKSPFTELSGGLPVEGWVRVGERNGSTPNNTCEESNLHGSSRNTPVDGATSRASNATARTTVC